MPNLSVTSITIHFCRDPLTVGKAYLMLRLTFFLLIFKIYRTVTFWVYVCMKHSVDYCCENARDCKEGIQGMNLLRLNLA